MHTSRVAKAAQMVGVPSITSCTSYCASASHRPRRLSQRRLERHIATIEGRTSSERSQKKFDDRILRRAIAKTEEDYADDAQRDAAEAEAIEEAGKHSRPPTDEERRYTRPVALMGTAGGSSNGCQGQRPAGLAGRTPERRRSVDEPTRDPVHRVSSHSAMDARDPRGPRFRG